MAAAATARMDGASARMGDTIIDKPMPPLPPPPPLTHRGMYSIRGERTPLSPKLIELVERKGEVDGQTNAGRIISAIAH